MRPYNAVVALTLFASAWAAAVDTGLHGSDVAFLAPKQSATTRSRMRSCGSARAAEEAAAVAEVHQVGPAREVAVALAVPRGFSFRRLQLRFWLGLKLIKSASSTSRGGARDNAGGATRTGSGPAPAYGGGKYYGGGAAVPYRAGAARGSMVPFFLVGGAALAFWPGLWLAGAHMYPYSHPYRYYNETARENQTKAVLCGCAEDLPCGCEENNATDYMNSLLGNGSYNGLNKTVVNIGEVNGTETILINGTLPNGTTAAGGDEEVGSAAFRTAVETLGFWPVAVVVLATVFAA
ncbi:conserved glycine-rich protein [Colletotrichum tofieldiae]|nr:conserved glycine-rich protein [Colletotrichum tofieldiae]